MIRRTTVWIAVAVGVGACGDGRPLAPDAEIWGCGDGVVAPDEHCDDGPETGTSTSLCTLECRTARVEWIQLEGNTQLPFPARKMVGGLPAHLVISNFDDRGIALVPVGNKGPPVILKKYAAPVSFEVHGVDRVVWIERAVPGVGGPWLLWTIIGEDPPVIREISYPVEGAEAGTFALRSVVGPNGFVWRDLDNELHHTTVSKVDPVTIDHRALGPAPSGQLQVARWWNDELVGYFFERPDQMTDVVIAWRLRPATERWTGVWRKPVMSAIIGRFRADLGDRQFAMLAPDGAIDVWSFDRDAPEIVDSLYGYVPAGSQHIMKGSKRIQTVDPQGRLVVLMDNGNGRSLAPQYLKIGPPCTVCTISETEGAPEWFALDEIAIHGFNRTVIE
jgi:hypothetical protein